jgi:hypothetical protein
MQQLESNPKAPGVKWKMPHQFFDCSANFFQLSLSPRRLLSCWKMNSTRLGCQWRRFCRLPGGGGGAHTPRNQPFRR